MNNVKISASKLQNLLSPVNEFLMATAQKGITFELFLHTFPGGYASTYPSDETSGESAVAESVSYIEIGDIYSYDGETGQYEKVSPSC